VPRGRTPAEEANNTMQSALKRDAHDHALSTWKRWRAGELSSRMGSRVLEFEPDDRSFRLYASARAASAGSALSPDDAEAVADEMQASLGRCDPSVYFQCMHIASSTPSLPSIALQMEHAMRARGFPPSAHASCIVARAFHNAGNLDSCVSWLASACDLASSNRSPESIPSEQPEITLTTDMLSSDCRANRLHSAHRIAAVLAEHKGAIYPSAVGHFMGICADEGFPEAIKCGASICIHWDLELDHGTLQHSLNELLINNEFSEQCEHLHAIMNNGGRDPPPEADVSLAEALARDDRFKASCACLLQAERKYHDLYDIKLDDGSYEALARILYGQPERQEAAWDAAKELLAERTQASSAVVQPILNACATDGELERAFAIFEEAESVCGITPDGDMYATLMVACNVAQRSKATPRLLEELRSSGVEPTARAWDAVVAADCRADDTNATAEHLRQMNAQPGFRPFKRTLRRAQAAAQSNNDRDLDQLANEIIDQHGLNSRPRVFKRYPRSSQQQQENKEEKAHAQVTQEH
jgi:hypothetical protein